MTARSEAIERALVAAVREDLASKHGEFIAARARVAEVEGALRLTVESEDTLRARVAKLEVAGRAVTNSPDQFYNERAERGDQYWIGVADGHRKATIDYYTALSSPTTQEKA